MKKGFKVLGLFLLSIVGLISFSSAGSVTYTGHLSLTNLSSNDNAYVFYFGLPNTVNSLNSPVYIDCYFSNISNLDSDFQVKPQGYIYFGNSVNRYYPATADPTDVKANNYHYTFERNDLVTFGLVNKVAGFTNSFDYSCTFSGLYIHGGSCPECQECETCPEVDTGSILSGYVAVSDIDMSYCVSNDLCPEMSGGYSALYINDIRHESMPFINITIPEEFNWDYSYTGNNTQFDLNVIGYNTDPDFIAGIINTQSTKPNSTDFNNIVSGLIPLLIPGLVIILFVWFIFKFIKKIF